VLQGVSLVHWAAVLGHADLMQLLLSNGATVSVKNKQVRFATVNVQGSAHIACNISCDSSSCAKLSKTILLECMSCPSEHPSDTFWSLRTCCWCMTLQGWSPLHLACAAGHAETVALLLSHGADVLDRRPGSGMTLLHMVCQGAEFEWEEQVHPEVLQNKAAYPDIVNILVSHGADINARDSKVRHVAQHCSCKLSSRSP